MSIYRGRSSKEFFLASLLYSAIEDQDLGAVVPLLKEKGADPNLVLPRGGLAPFHLAVGVESDTFALQATLLLLRHGGNPNIRSDEGLTPVHIAAAWGRLDVLHMLLLCGGDPEVYDGSRKTPLNYAANEDHVECLELLKTFLSDKIPENFFRKSKADQYSLILDKILIDNGTAVGEYEIQNEITNGVSNTVETLECLPEATSKELVSTWCEKNQKSLSQCEIYQPPMCGTGDTPEQSDCSSSVCESDKGLSRPFNLETITFKKVYRKTRKVNRTPPSTKHSIKVTTSPTQNDHKAPTCSLIDPLEESSLISSYSKESGIVTLPDSQNELKEEEKSVVIPIAQKDTTSDYMTCSFQSEPNTLERNIFEITDDLSNQSISLSQEIKPSEIQANNVMGSISDISNNTSFVSLSEVYKYVDKEEGVVLYERRLLKTPSENSGNSERTSLCSKLSSLPENLDYDTDSLRRELTELGFAPGPLTCTTKRLYLRKLHRLRKKPVLPNSSLKPPKKVYSVELEKTLRDPRWVSDLSPYKSLEAALSREFSNPDPSRKWREGVTKASFTYLLLDPRITQNLPCRTDAVQPATLWETFISSVFYVGKGKRSRPYAHLYQAAELWNNGQRKSSNRKLQRILDIWQAGQGVVCLHIFQNVIPVEAYTREAAMIAALRLDNLDNARQGDFYGVAATWPQRHKKMLGVLLLYKAMWIFLNEGERQICPTDIQQ